MEQNHNQSFAVGVGSKGGAQHLLNPFQHEVMSNLTATLKGQARDTVIKLVTGPAARKNVPRSGIEVWPGTHQQSNTGKSKVITG